MSGVSRKSDELVVLCSSDGIAIGTAPKRTVHNESTRLHLAFSCYVVTDAGDLLVTRRSRTKMTWPGVITNSCCGHPLPSESMRSAIARRLDCELGIGLSTIDLILPDFSYSARMPNGILENELCPVFRAIVPLDCTITPNYDEVDAAWWSPWLYFTQSIHNGQEVSPWCAMQSVALSMLADRPIDWPVASTSALPPAATA
jgi:isopentenyl-diphosphate delta-isomerase